MALQGHTHEQCSTCAKVGPSVDYVKRAQQILCPKCDLPMGWRMYWSKQHKRPFYYEAASKQVRWGHPALGNPLERTYEKGEQAAKKPFSLFGHTQPSKHSKRAHSSRNKHHAAQGGKGSQPSGSTHAPAAGPASYTPTPPGHSYCPAICPTPGLLSALSSHVGGDNAIHS